MFEFRGHKEARKFCQANPINDIQTRERERERERLFIVSRYEDAFYAFPKTWGEKEGREGGRVTYTNTILNVSSFSIFL